MVRLERQMSTNHYGSFASLSQLVDKFKGEMPAKRRECAASFHGLMDKFNEPSPVNGQVDSLCKQTAYYGWKEN